MATVSSAASASPTGESSTVSTSKPPALKTSCAGAAVTAPGSPLLTATVIALEGIAERRTL